MDRALDGLTRLGVPVLVLLAALTGLATTLAANGFAVRPGCDPRTGVPDLLTSHLALVREIPRCRAATELAGAHPGAAVTVIAVLAIPLLLAQLGVLTVATVASAALRRTARRLIVLVAAALGAVLALVRRPVPVALPGHRQASPWWAVPMGTGRRATQASVIRGPPARLAVA